MLAHGHFLSRDSEFFTSALKKKWAEGLMRTFKLPEASSVVMAHYLTFAYEAKLPTAHHASAGEHLAADDVYPLLATLYVYGEQFLNRPLHHSVLSEMVRLIQLEDADSFWIPAADSVNITYRGTTEHSPARRFLVDVHFLLGNEAWLSLECEPQFLLDVLKAFYEATAAPTDDVEQSIANLRAEEYF